MIENFQSHVRTKVRFAESGQLTVILGPSDSGKTAIIRALRWLKFNDAPGDFIRLGAEFARVSLKMEDGTVVARERGKSYNRYFTVIGGQRQTYEGFGTGVPLEIQQLLGAWPVAFGDVEIRPTISEQLDTPFLGGKSISAPAKARVFGKLAGTAEVDLAMREAAADALKASQAAKRAEDEIAQLEAQIAGYAYLEDLERRVKAAEEALAKHDAARERAQALIVLENRLNSISREIGREVDVLLRLQVLPAAELALTNAASATAKCSQLEKAQIQLNAIQVGLAETERKLNILRGIEATNVIIQKAAEKLEVRTRLIQHQQTLSGIAQLIGMAQQTLAKSASSKAAAAVISQVEKQSARVTALTRLKQTLDGLNQRISITQQIQTGNAGAEAALEKLKVVPEKLTRMAALKKQRDRLDLINHDLVNAEMSIQFITERVQKTQQEYIDTLTAAGICPTCGNQINPECLKEVV